MKPDISRNGVDWTHKLDSNATITFRFREIRRERTGNHALVAILQGQSILAYDVFNIGRSEDRARLGKRAFSMLSDLDKPAYPLDHLQHDLDITCLDTPDEWEQGHVNIVQFDPNDPITPVEYIAKPYLIKGGGTIIFAPPGSGKSFVLQAIAVCVASGIGTLWDVEQHPALYISLERNINLLRSREAGLRNAIGWPQATQVSYLDARGLGLRQIERKARQFSDDHEGAVVFLDSVSRAALGGLKEDETATQFIDLMNSIGETWMAVGHTPRATGDHLFGSMHFDAGEDIGVKLWCVNQETTLAIGLEIVKANDTPKGQKHFYALEFKDNHLTKFESTSEKKYPQLIAGDNFSRLDILKGWMAIVGSASAPEAAEATGLYRTDIVTFFTKTGEFKVVGKREKQVLYALKNQV